MATNGPKQPEVLRRMLKIEGAVVLVCWLPCPGSNSYYQQFFFLKITRYKIFLVSMHKYGGSIALLLGE